MPRLMLDPGARILSDAEGLQLVHRRGTFRVRGNGINVLHERVAPFLDGRFTRTQLLRAAGDRAAALKNYLRRLDECGVLYKGHGLDSLPPAFPQACCGIQSLRIGRHRIAVTLAGEEAEDSSSWRLSFADRRQIERRLISTGEQRLCAGRVWIITEGDTDEAELRRRAVIARHILAVKLGQGLPRDLCIFELAAQRWHLRRLGELKAGERGGTPLPQQLQWIRLNEAPQLPLVSLVGELVGHGRQRLACGLQFDQVRQRLMIEFLGREALLDAADRGLLTCTVTQLGKNIAAGQVVPLTREEAARAVLSETLSGCTEQLVAAWALGLRQNIGSEVDLLTIAPPSERAALLQSALRLRLRSLPARLEDGMAPLVVLRLANFAVARIGLEEAVVEALLRMTARHFLDAQSEPIICAPSACRGKTVCRRLRAVIARLPQPLRIATGRIRRFGLTFYYAVSLD